MIEVTMNGILKCDLLAYKKQITYQQDRNQVHYTSHAIICKDNVLNTKNTIDNPKSQNTMPCVLQYSCKPHAIQLFLYLINYTLTFISSIKGMAGLVEYTICILMLNGVYRMGN